MKAENTTPRRKGMIFEVYSHRWGHNDRYRIERTESGWDVEHAAINGSCDKTGHPYLFKNLKQDSISYPRDLGDHMEWLWHMTEAENLSEGEVQVYLEQVAAWVRLVEQSAPREGIWRGLK